MNAGRSPRVSVVGGGVVGASIAFQLAQTEQCQVTLFESGGTLGTGATSAAIGGITPQSESYCRGPLRHVAVWSTQLYPQFIDRLERSVDVHIPVLSTGQLQVALDDAEMERIISELLPPWNSEGFETRVLSGAETLLAEPSLNSSVRGSVLLPIEFALEPAVLMAAIGKGLAALPNVAVHAGVTIRSMTSSRRAVALETMSGHREEADVAVIATGLGTPVLLPFLRDRIYPMRGQAIEFRASERGYPLNHHVYCAADPGRSAYLVPRADGRVVGGVTYEPHDRTTKVDDITLDRIRAGLRHLCPAITAWRELRAWSGVRPASIDGIPYIGPVDEWKRILVCAGHQGLGVTLAPASASMIEELVFAKADSASAEVKRALEICAPDRPQHSTS